MLSLLVSFVAWIRMSATITDLREQLMQFKNENELLKTRLEVQKWNNGQLRAALNEVLPHLGRRKRSRSIQ